MDMSRIARNARTNAALAMHLSYLQTTKHVRDEYVRELKHRNRKGKGGKPGSPSPKFAQLSDSQVEDAIDKLNKKIEQHEQHIEGCRSKVLARGGNPEVEADRRFLRGMAAT